MIKNYIFVLVILLVSLTFVSAQWVESPNFVEVSSTQVGSLEQGCYVACMSGMIASINHPNIGTNPDPIIEAMNKSLHNTGETFPYNQADVIAAAVKFIIMVLR